MFPDAKSAPIDAKPAGHLGGLQGIDIQHSQQVAILRAHRLQRDADLFAAAPIDQNGQRILFFTGEQGLRASEPAKGARLAMRAAPQMQTDVARRLKDKGGKRIEVLHTFVAQRLQNAADRFLSDIFRHVAVAQAARRKYTQP